MAHIARRTIEPKSAPRHIRSLVKVTLPRFFKPDVYIWNRYSHSDALLIDIGIRNNEKHLGPFRRMALLKALTSGAQYKPAIFIEPTCPSVSEDDWKTDILLCSHLQLDGFSVKGWREGILEDMAKLLAQRNNVTHMEEGIVIGDGTSHLRIRSPCSLHHSFMVNVAGRSLSYAIFEYHQLWEASQPTLHMKELEKSAEKAREMGVQPLAIRARRCVSYRDIETEFRTLREIGFVGVVIRNPDLINLVHAIFS